MTVIDAIDLLANRFPSRRESLLVLSVCIVPFHLWASIVFLYNFPGLILKANVWEILGVAAYVFTFALIECLFLFGLILLLSVILPGHLFRAFFVPLGSSLAIILSGIAVLVNNETVMERIWVFIPMGLGVIAFFISLVRRPFIQGGMSVLAERITLLAGLYALFDIAFVFYLVSRLLIL